MQRSRYNWKKRGGLNEDNIISCHRLSCCDKRLIDKQRCIYKSLEQAIHIIEKSVCRKVLFGWCLMLFSHKRKGKFGASNEGKKALSELWLITLSSRQMFILIAWMKWMGILLIELVATIMKDRYAARGTLDMTLHESVQRSCDEIRPFKRGIYAVFATVCKTPMESLVLHVFTWEENNKWVFSTGCASRCEGIVTE